MSYDIAAEFDRTAMNGCREGVVHDERDAVVVSKCCELLDIKDINSRIGDRLTEDALGIGSDILLKLFERQCLINECALDTHLLEGYSEEIVCTAVDICGCDEMIACLADIEYCEEVCCLTGACEHSGKSAFHLAELCSYIIICRILKSCIEIS